MTIEEQLRAIARHADQHQPVITAAEILQRASGRHDPTASRRHLTIAPPAGGAGSEPVMQISDDSADAEHKTRWRSPAVAAAAIVVLGVGAIAFAVSNTTADDPDGVPQAPAPTAAPTTAAPTTTVAPRIVSDRTRYGSPTSRSPTPCRTAGKHRPATDSWSIAASSVVNFWDVDNVYADGCEHTLLDPPLGPTVDDLANVWATLPGFTATTPVDIVVDGYAGKRVDYTVPDYPTVVDPATGEDEADCVEQHVRPVDRKVRRAGSELLGPGPGATEPTVDHRRRRHPTRDQRMVRTRHHARTTRRHGRIPRLHPDRLTRSRLSRTESCIDTPPRRRDCRSARPVNHFHRRHQPPNHQEG